MQHRPFDSQGHLVPLIGQGTWQLEQADPARAVVALRRGLDLGMTHVDTAEMYGSGMAEELVAKAIQGRRDEAFLVSKVLPHHATRAGTLAACEKSLARLRTDRLDCYLLHWRGPHPLQETIAGLEQLRAAGKILAWGVSNFDVADLEDVRRLIDITVPGRCACNQVLYHLKQRAIEHAVLPWCQRWGVAVVGYSPFGHGDFPDAPTPGGRVLQEIGARHGVSAHQAALAFLVRRAPLFTIPKSSSPERTAQNAAAGSLVLTPTELGRIDQAFPLGAASDELPML